MTRRSRSKGGTPPRTQGARRATGESGGGALAVGQRWSAGRKREVVLRILRGELIPSPAPPYCSGSGWWGCTSATDVAPELVLEDDSAIAGSYRQDRGARPRLLQRGGRRRDG